MAFLWRSRGDAAACVCGARRVGEPDRSDRAPPIQRPAPILPASRRQIGPRTRPCRRAPAPARRQAGRPGAHPLCRPEQLRRRHLPDAQGLAHHPVALSEGAKRYRRCRGSPSPATTAIACATVTGRRVAPIREEDALPLSPCSTAFRPLSGRAGGRVRPPASCTRRAGRVSLPGNLIEASRPLSGSLHSSSAVCRGGRFPSVVAARSSDPPWRSTPCPVS
jgi:hypothetical protein